MFITSGAIPLDDINTADISITDNQQPLGGFSFQNSMASATGKRSVIISVDNSSSMAGKFETVIKPALIRLLNNIDFSRCEVAIQTFNNRPFINSYYSADKAALLQSLNFIGVFGSTSYPRLIGDGFSGMKTLLAEAAYEEKAVFIISDGGPAFSDNSLPGFLVSNNARLFLFDVSGSVPKALYDAAADSEGMAFLKGAGADDLSDLFLYSYYIAAGYKPARITLTSKDCGTKRKLLLKYKSEAQKSLEYELNPEEMLSLSFSSKIIDYGLIEAESQRLREVTVTAGKLPMTVQSLSSTNNKFTFADISIGEVVPAGAQKKFRVFYSGQDTAYTAGKIIIVFDNCRTDTLIVTAGSAYKSDGISRIKVRQPDGGEKYYGGTYADITWDGTSPNDAVNIDFSADGGDGWDIAAKSVTGNRYRWAVPDISSDMALVRVKKPSSSGELFKVKYLFNPKPLKSLSRISWSSEEKALASAYEDGAIYVWDLQNDTRKILTNGTGKVTGLEWAPFSSFVASSFEDAENRIIVWDTTEGSTPVVLKNSPSKIRAISWDRSGAFLFSANEDGDLYVWDISVPADFIKKIDAHSSRANAISHNPIYPFVVSGGDDKFLRFFSSPGYQPMKEIELTGAIRSVSWSNDGENLLVLTDDNRVKNLKVTYSLGTVSVFSDENWKNALEGKEIFSGLDFDHIKEYDLLTAGNKVFVQDAIEGNSVYSFAGHGEKHVSYAAFGNNFYVASADNEKILVWNVNDRPHDSRPLDMDESDAVFSILPLNVKSANADLGEFCVASTLSGELAGILENRGELPLVLDSAKFIKNSEYSLVGDYAGHIVGPGEKLSLLADFTPSAEGIRSDTLVFYFGEKKYKSYVQGRGVASDYQQTAEELEFEDTERTTEVTVQVQVLINNSAEKLRINSISTMWEPGVFNLNNSQPIEVAPGEPLVLSITFRPGEAIKYSGLLSLYTEDLCTPVRLFLNGRGTDPNIDIIDTLTFGSAMCYGEKITASIPVSHGLASEVTVQGVSIEAGGQSRFFVGEDYTGMVINPDVEEYLTMEYLATENTVHFGKAFISLKIGGKDKHYEVVLKGSKDSVGFTLDNGSAEFDVTEEGQKFTKNITVRNTGNTTRHIEPPINYDRFIVLKAEPGDVEPGAATELTVEFQGGELGKSYEQEMDFLNVCGEENYMKFVANVGNKSPLIFHKEEITASFTCSDLLSDTAYIYNTGNRELIITKVVQHEPGTDELQVKEPSGPVSVAPGDSARVIVDFTLASEETHPVAFIDIHSNAVNVQNGISTLAYAFDTRKVSFAISEEDINIDKVKPGKPFIIPVTVKNTGTRELVLNPSSTLHFNVKDIIPSIVQPEQSATAEIEFAGGLQGETIDEEVIFADACGHADTVRIIITVAGPQSILLLLPDIKANSGETVEIAVNVANYDNVDISSMDSIKSTLEFNGSLLYPVDVHGYKTAYDTATNIRTIEIAEKYDPSGGAQFTRLKFIATLGDTSETPLILKRSTHNGSSDFYVNDEQRGSFSLTDVCYQGGARFIEGNDAWLVLHDNEPNPFFTSTTIKFSTIEKGRHKFAVYSGEGLLIFSDEKDLPHNISSEYIFNGSNLPSGVYIYTLETPSSLLVKKMVLQK